MPWELWILANILNDFAKGRFVQLATLPLGTDSLVWVLLQSTSLPTDATIQTTQYLSGILSTGTGTGLECTFTNYARTVMPGTSITITVNTSTNVVTLDTSNVVIGAAGGAANNTVAAAVLCYKPTSSTADTAIPVLTKHDFSATTAGGTLTVTIPSVATGT